MTDFLALYVRLLNLAHRCKVLIDVVGRYLARVDRTGDDLKAVAIRARYFEALIFNGRYREAAALQQQLLPIDDRLGDSGSRLYVLAAKLTFSALISPMPLHEFEIVKREALTILFRNDRCLLPKWR